MHNRTTKKCSIAGCTTCRRGLQSRRLCCLPLENVDPQLQQKVLAKFKVNVEEKACRKCRYRITAFMKKTKGCNMPTPAIYRTSINTTISSSTSCTTSPTTTVSIGRPRINYTKASEATRRRMKASARMVLQNTVGECNKISQGDGWDLLQDVTSSTPIKKMRK